MKTFLGIFEDDTYANFFPVTFNRPVWLLRSGIRLLWEKIEAAFPGTTVGFSCRDLLAETAAEQVTGSVNVLPETAERIVLVNGRLAVDRSGADVIAGTQPPAVFLDGETVAAIILDPKTAGAYLSNLRSLWERGAQRQLVDRLPRKPFKGRWTNYLWELVAANGDEIARDFAALAPALDFKKMFDRCEVDQQTVIHKVEQVYLGEGAKIDAGTVLDARSGPIFIDRQVTIQAQTRVEGPAYIGPRSILVGGRIRSGSSVGPVCRIGGEVEQSIFLGHDNKYHDGFLGHAYVGQWVNLGALTTNSDLKNNYGTVRVEVAGREVDTGLLKVGSFIGDHVRTGIGTLLNTGISIGFCSNLYGGGMFAQKSIPPFSWGTSGKIDEYQVDQALLTAEQVQRRREVAFSPAQKRLFLELFEQFRAGKRR